MLIGILIYIIGFFVTFLIASKMKSNFMTAIGIAIGWFVIIPIMAILFPLFVLYEKISGG